MSTLPKIFFYFRRLRPPSLLKYGLVQKSICPVTLRKVGWNIKTKTKAWRRGDFKLSITIAVTHVVSQKICKMCAAAQQEQMSRWAHPPAVWQYLPIWRDIAFIATFTDMEVFTLYIWKQINIVRKESSSIHMSLNINGKISILLLLFSCERIVKHTTKNKTRSWSLILIHRIMTTHERWSEGVRGRA